MPRTRQETIKDQVRSAFLETGSIKRAAKLAGASRNAAKRFLREEGLTAARTTTTPVPCEHAVAPNSASVKLWAVDFSLLEKLFETGRERLENLSFTDHIRRIAEAMARELNVSNTVDQIRLETAVAEYLIYRRFYMKSLDATDANYEGPFVKRHDKLARAVVSWVGVSSQALGNFLRLIRELELRNQKAALNLGRGNTFVGQQQINVGAPVQEAAPPSKRVANQL